MIRRISWLLTSLLALVIVFPGLVGQAAGDSPLDAFLGGYQAGLLLAAGLVSLGAVAAYVGLRPRMRGRHARGTVPVALEISASTVGGAMTPAGQSA